MAREADYNFDLPSAPLAISLARFSRITGMSVGYPGDLPPMTTRRVHGRMSADTALRKLLAGSRLRPVVIAPRLYRLEAAHVHPPLPASPLPPAEPGTDLIVTAPKRPQSLGNLAMSASVLDLSQPGKPSPLSSRDVSFDLEGLATTNLGPGRNRLFIRGVADSPFLGQSQSTVSVLMDETRITFDAPDPDLRLVDVERVEVLKGPQGSLYGSGALGGIYHIVTQHPRLDETTGWMRLSASAVTHGDIGNGAEAMVNVPLVEDKLAVRTVAYRFLDSGWLDEKASGKDSNSTSTAGLRVGLKWTLSPNMTVDAGYTGQRIDSRDSQYVLDSDDSLRRPPSIPEPTRTHFQLVQGTVSRQIGTLKLVSATSYVDHDFDNRLDASAAAAEFGLQGTVRFDDRRYYSLFSQEIRLLPNDNGRWVAGLSYLSARTQGTGTMATDQSTLLVQQNHRIIREYALFGEVTLPTIFNLEATVGARLYRSVSEEEVSQPRRAVSEKAVKTILSPNVALSYRLSDGGLLYLRYARALRPGGLTPAGMRTSNHFEADELGTLDAGIRRNFRDDRLSIAASGYYTLWNDIQSDFLLPRGLISTRNAGRARIMGLEASADWNMGARWNLSMGVSALHARLTRTADGIKLDDRHLPIAPSIAARAKLSRQYSVAGWSGESSLQANYRGHTRLSFDDDLDRRIEENLTAAFSSVLERSHWAATLSIDNIFDVRGDSFGFGNPFSIRLAPQYTPLRPRTLTMSIARRW